MFWLSVPLAVHELHPYENLDECRVPIKDFCLFAYVYASFCSFAHASIMISNPDVMVLRKA